VPVCGMDGRYRRNWASSAQGSLRHQSPGPKLPRSTSAADAALSLARSRSLARARARSLSLSGSQPRLPRPARHRAKTVTGTVGRTRRRGGRPSAWAVELGVLCKGTIDSAFENACRGLGDPSLRLCHVRVPGQHHLSSFILDLRRGYVAPDDLVQVGPPSIVRAKR